MIELEFWRHKVNLPVNDMEAETLNITNITKWEYIFFFNKKAFVLKKWETKSFVAYIAAHWARHIAYAKLSELKKERTDKEFIKIFNEVIWKQNVITKKKESVETTKSETTSTDDKPEDEGEDKPLDISEASYAELKEIAKGKWISISTKWKPKTKAALVADIANV